MRWHFVTLLVFTVFASPVTSAPLKIKTINEAQLHGPMPTKEQINPILIKAQVLLDRAHFSPGEIDGKSGDNFKKALAAFAATQGLNSGGQLNAEVWQRLTSPSSEPVLIEYTISDEDVRGSFVKKIPAQLEKMKDLPALPYTSPREKLAEKFHMSQELLSTLNPRQKFETANDRIVVANIAVNGTGKGHSCRGRQKRSGFEGVRPRSAASGNISNHRRKHGKTGANGRLKVTSITKNPTYRYNPKYGFKGVRATEPFTVKPGPNNPVGVVWIGLSDEGYGIHGTPDPSKVSKTASHGCIRLTNWDALRVASAVAKGTPVDFSGDEQTASRSRAEAPRRRQHR
jgi:lipoprotein-anchoring transpeptidase ErfK/SrfK